ncbi:hypothetical protein FAES_1317 [Fibrella aestuarina BUZ 2]|uniref:Uncharacterized protein n=1 Tax=Fibrella aestuarina BUZ 2 TaxID=1166018 RepID=I0K5C4_9BACT|nr:DUF6134 family protein [Fibrella aestuarina]CCG99327.1 hypothetical protein FAES_1317 [Fibrella aestuarina BUZ 2]
MINTKKAARKLLALTILLLVTSLSVAQSLSETHHYAIEVAGARIGTMTASRESRANNEVMFIQISDVQVNFLVYKLKVYYKVVSLMKNGQLLRSTVEAHTNKGDFSSLTEWTGTHYDIRADQYKYSRRATETRKIDFTVSMLYFSEPTSHQRAYAEYFGDYFTLTTTPRSSYRAQLADREDEYVYEQGRLVKVIKKNALKNFVIRLLD